MTAKARKNETVAEESQAPQKGILRDYVETILICVIFVIFSRAFVFQQSKIPSASMMDTLLVGDYIMVNRFVYSPFDFGWERSLLPQRAVRRGDVVVFKFPPEPEIDYIKRVVGMPGERIELRDGHLYVDGEFLDEPTSRSSTALRTTTRISGRPRSYRIISSCSAITATPRRTAGSSVRFLRL